MSTDQAAAYLAEVRERRDTAENARWHDYATALELVSKALRSVADIPRLVGAVEAVLALHEQESRIDRVVFCEPHQSAPWDKVCADCVVTYVQRCKHCSCSGPCPTYAAITAELLKEDR